MCPSGEADQLLLGGACRIIPGHKFIDAIDLVIGDACQYPGQPGLRIDAIKFCGFDQGECNGHGFAAAF